MRNFGIRSRLGLAVLVGGLMVTGCEDDETTDNDQEVNDSAVEVEKDSGTPAKKDSAVAQDEDAATVGEDASTNPDLDSGTPADAGNTADASTTPDASTFPQLPAVLSLSGCTSLQVPALCSVTQTNTTFTANCAGTTYSGTINADRAVTLTRPETTNADTAKVNLSCTGQLQVAGTLALDCKQTVSAAGDKPASEGTCKLVSDKTIQPGVSCLELPATITDLVVCKEGAAAGADTLTGGSCKVIQDGCAFQAECANNITLSGTVSKTGVTFTRRLKALADAATPAPPSTAAPAFLKGAEVNHSCSGAIAAGKLTGSCTAGALRGGTATSVCANEGTVPAVPVCSLLAPTNEHIFVLDSCDNLKLGEGQNPGIGEPVCALRQNNCIWDIQCGNDPLTKFSGRLTPGAGKLEWRLLTGTPCELTVGKTSGAIRGKCTVPGQTACDLSNKPAVAGGPSCPVLPPNTDPRSNGCGGGDPLSCRGSVQHGCNYLGICDFTANFPDNIIAGTTSYKSARAHFEFNGLSDYKCYVDQATAAEIASGERAANEWYGQCTNSAGGMCRDNYNPTTGTGFRGLRVYWDAIAPAP